MKVNTMLIWKKITLFLLSLSATGLVVLFFYSPAVFGEYGDEDMILEEDESDGDDASRYKSDAANHAVRKKDQMRKWLKQLESLKRSRKEAPILSLASKILNQDPNNVQALNVLGAFYLQSGKIQLAKIIFTRALKKHPKNSSLHSNLAVIALKEDKKEEAIAAFQKSLGYRYSNYSAAANLGTLYVQAYEYDASLEYLSLAYSRAKQYLSLGNYEVLKTGNNYAVALSWSGDFDKAEDIFEELIEKNPGSVELLLNYAILLGKDLKEREKSYEFLQKADLMDRSGRFSRRIKSFRRYLESQKKAGRRS